MVKFREIAYQNIGTEVVGLQYEMKVYRDCPETLPEMFENSIKQFRNSECFVWNDQRLTYEEFGLLVRKLASSLEKINIKRGDRVAILLENCLEFPISFFAIQHLGAIAVVLNARCQPPELEYMINDSGSVLLITTKELLEKFIAVNIPLNTLEVIITDSEPVEGTLRFSDLIDLSIFESPETPEIHTDDAAAILYTSGTTGLPKGAVQTHRNLISNASIAKKLLGFTQSDRTLIVAPFFHATGVNSQMIGMIYSGGVCVVRPYFKTDDFMAWIEKEKITVAIGVATMFWFMITSPAFPDYDFSSLRAIVYGGSPAPVELVKRLKEIFPIVELGNVWGLTECTSITTLLPDVDSLRKTDSVGIPAPTLEVKVIDHIGCEVNRGEVGELIVKGPSVVKGYWNKPVETAQTFVDGWLKTGDIGKMDDEGYIYILDRKKDMIIRGGQNIYSQEVENVLYQHSKVLEAAVVGIPDQAFGEQVKAYIVLKPGETATEEEIIAFCQVRIAKYKTPQVVTFLEMLPRNPGGKILKTQLKLMARESGGIG